LGALARTLTDRQMQAIAVTRASECVQTKRFNFWLICPSDGAKLRWYRAE
jgi:hypothetical protein